MTTRHAVVWLVVPLLFVMAFGAARAMSGARIAASAPIASAPPEHHFEPWDVVLDSAGAPLAAWQVSIERAGGVAAPSIVGIEGGEPAAYAEPPAHDPAALATGRVVLGAFSLRDPAELPHERFRAATIHLDFPTTPRSDALRVRVDAAADHAGNPVSVEATLVRRRNP